MACFIVPATEAVVTTVAKKVAEKKEKENNVQVQEDGTEKFSAKLGRLNKLLWGGSALLAFEHVWHGEVSAFFPFLTAAKNAESLQEMLHEMSTVGVGMAVLTTAVWGISCMVIDAIDKRGVNLASKRKGKA